VIAIVHIRTIDIDVPAIGFGEEMQDGRVARVRCADDQFADEGQMGHGPVVGEQDKVPDRFVFRRSDDGAERVKVIVNVLDLSVDSPESVHWDRCDEMGASMTNLFLMVTLKLLRKIR